MRSFCYLLGLMLLANALAQNAIARKWADATGKFEIEAEFIGLTADNRVRLSTDDGKTFSIPLDQLCEADKRFVRAAKKPSKSSPFSDLSQNVAVAPLDGSSNELRPDKDSHLVVAEGVGITPQKALKDAFRSAVRQVVGTVVDAKTLVKNDELVDDQVLTYSDGFLKQHRVLKESKVDGLFRIRISALVQRRSLVMKLRAANITVKKIDGESMFGDITTQLQAKNDSAALVRNALDGFPLNCISAEISGKPEVVKRGAEKSTLSIKVAAAVQEDAFRAFSKRLIATLDGIAKRKGEFSLTANTWTQNNPMGRRQPSGFSLKTSSYGLDTLHRKALGFSVKQPRRRGDDDRDIAIAVNTSHTRSHTRSEWKYFVLDRSTLAEFAGPAASVMELKLTLRGEGDETVAVARTVLCGSDQLGWDAIAPLAFDCVDYDLNFSSSNHPKMSGFWAPGFRAITNNGQSRLGQSRLGQSRLGLIGPVFFTESLTSFFPSLELGFQFELSPEEIAAVKSASVEVAFDGELPPSRKVMKAANDR
jgi:hypothetical protein